VTAPRKQQKAER